MVDALHSYSETEIVSGLEIAEDNLFVRDSRLAEAGLVEHMAQSVALHTGYQFFLRNEPAPTGYIGAISSISIQRLPELGEKVITTVRILQEFGGITLVDISSKIGDEEIAVGQMKTVLAK